MLTFAIFKRVKYCLKILNPFEHKTCQRYPNITISFHKVMVKWSECSPSTSTIRVRIPRSLQFFCNIVFEKKENKQKRGLSWPTFFKKNNLITESVEIYIVKRTHCLNLIKFNPLWAIFKPYVYFKLHQ